VEQGRGTNANSARDSREKYRIETAAGKRGQFPAQRKKSEMSLHLSHSLPTFRLNFSGDDFNEYRLCQGCVEFRANHGAWRILGEDEVHLHYVLHTEVGKWLKSQSANQNGIGVAPGNS
jgi:hypothetical protein